MKYDLPLADASKVPYWLDSPDRPEAPEALAGRGTPDLGRVGELAVATAAWQAEELASVSAEDDGVEFLDEAAVRAEVHSPTYFAGLWDKDGCALVDPARLAWGLRDACLRLGVRIYEQTRV